MNSNLCNKIREGCKSKTHKKVCLYLHKLCPERKILQDMTADSVHSSTRQKGPDSCHSDLVCRSMSNSPCDTALLQTHTKNTVKLLRRQMKLLLTNTHLNNDRSHHYHLCSNKKEPVSLQLWQYICIFLRHYTNPNVTTNSLIYRLKNNQ